MQCSCEKVARRRSNHTLWTMWARVICVKNKVATQEPFSKRAIICALLSRLARPNPLNRGRRGVRKTLTSHAHVHFAQTQQPSANIRSKYLPYHNSCVYIYIYIYFTTKTLRGEDTLYPCRFSRTQQLYSSNSDTFETIRAHHGWCGADPLRGRRYNNTPQTRNDKNKKRGLLVELPWKFIPSLQENRAGKTRSTTQTHWHKKHRIPHHF